MGYSWPQASIPIDCHRAIASPVVGLDKENTIATAPIGSGDPERRDKYSHELSTRNIDVMCRFLKELRHYIQKRWIPPLVSVWSASIGIEHIGPLVEGFEAEQLSNALGAGARDEIAGVLDDLDHRRACLRSLWLISLSEIGLVGQ